MFICLLLYVSFLGGEKELNYEWCIHFIFVYLFFSNSYSCSLHLRSGFGLFDVFKVDSQLESIPNVVAIISCELECCVGSSRSLNCTNYSLHLPSHSSGVWRELDYCSCFKSVFTLGWQHPHADTIRKGAFRAQSADTSEQQSLGLKTFTLQCACPDCASSVSFICSKILPLGRSRVEDMLNPRTLPRGLRAWCLCEVTVSGISFRGYHLLSCHCPFYY